MTTRYHGHIIGDKSDKDQNAALRVEMGNPIVMEIKEAKSGEDVTYTLSWPYSLFTGSEEKLEFHRKFRATNIAVALPAIVGAKMCVEGGTREEVIAPEGLDPIKFLKMMADMGAPVKLNEVLSKRRRIDDTSVISG